MDIRNAVLCQKIAETLVRHLLFPVGHIPFGSLVKIKKINFKVNKSVLIKWT